MSETRIATTTDDQNHVDNQASVVARHNLYIGGAFSQSESGRSYPITDRKGKLLAHAAQASRKDAREAVATASASFPVWSSQDAYSRGQILYRVAKFIQQRADEFITEVNAAEGLTAKRARTLIDAGIDRWVWYAGWSDKFTSVLGAITPVGPDLSTTTPQPTGVVALLAPQESSFLGLISVLAPAIATGNTTVVVASQDRPLPAISLAEVLVAADLPAGVVNILTGRTAELAPWLAAHVAVNAIDLTGAPKSQRTELERLAINTVKRIQSPAQNEDFTKPPDLARLRAFVEYKTIQRPIGR